MDQETAAHPQAAAMIAPAAGRGAMRPTAMQLRWLRRGLNQAGGKLPLFDRQGQRVSDRTVRACLEQGWAESWFANPLKPDWLVCRLTPRGREVASKPSTDRASTARASAPRTSAIKTRTMAAR